MRVLQAILKRLAVLALGVSSGTAGAAGQLARIPDDVAEAALDAEELADMTPSDRAQILLLFGSDDRPSVRRLVAAGLEGADPDHPAAEQLASDLVLDPDPAVQETAMTSLATLLGRSSPFMRTYLVCRWAMSPAPRRRLAIARALRAPFGALGVGPALERLAGDEDPEVRAAVAEASGARFAHNPALCRRLLVRLAGDEDPAVGRAARAALDRAAGA